MDVLAAPALTGERMPLVLLAVVAVGIVIFVLLARSIRCGPRERPVLTRPRLLDAEDEQPDDQLPYR